MKKPATIIPSIALDDEAAVVFGGAHAVVANPPYIVCQDKPANDAYRLRYVSATAKFGLGVPFTERLFQLAVPSGFVGQITSNAFMKREHGKALVEKVLPRLDLTLIVDTSGAYIPGHGTPTCLMFGRNRAPTSDKVHVVMGKRGEPTTPKGIYPLGWSIVDQLHKALPHLSTHLRAMHGGSTTKEEANRVASAWALGAMMARALEDRRIGFERREDEHLADTFERVWNIAPWGTEWFDPDGDAPWTRIRPSFLASCEIRTTVDKSLAKSPFAFDSMGRGPWATPDTDWVGDAYQQMNEWARKGLALAQTPRFVRELILDRTLEPALAEFGLPGIRALDPTCGTGHFLLDIFWRLYQRHADPDDGPPECTYVGAAQRALDCVLGADINKEAVGLSRFRLLLGYCDAAGVRHVSSVPELPTHLVTIDSLLAGEPRPSPPVFETTATKPIPSPVEPAQLGLLWDAAE
jgi:hypothetical protein